MKSLLTHYPERKACESNIRNALEADDQRLQMQQQEPSSVHSNTMPIQSQTSHRFLWMRIPAIQVERNHRT